MPFTLAHPAAVLPLHRLGGPRTVLSALVIGSMSPDFPYFLLGAEGGFTHSLPGMFLYCLPMGWVAFLLFHHLLKRPLAELLPGSWRDRLPSGAFQGGPPPGRSWAAISACLLAGAATHVLWDAFTHPYGALYQAFPALRSLRVHVFHQGLPLCKVLQHASTLLGGIALAAVLRRRFLAAPAPRAGRRPGPSPRIRVLLLALVLAGALVGGLPPLLRKGPGGLDRRAFPLVVGTVNGGALPLVGYAVAATLLRALRARRPRRA